MKDKDYIKDLFNEKLSGFEANVRPELWSSISSQIVTPVATTVSSGMSFITKTLIGVSVAASLGVIVFYVVNRSGNELTQKKNTQKTENVVETKTGQEEKENFHLDSQSHTQTSKNTEETREFITSFKEENVVTLDNTESSPLVSEQKQKFIQESPVKQNSDQITPSMEIAEPVEKPQIVVSEPTIETTEEKGSIGDLFNIFTPNRDGTNDVLYVESQDVTDFSIVVIDQQNKIVFQSSDATFNWDGTGINGDPVPVGKYVYYVTARNSVGKVITKHSVLEITR